MKTKFNRKIPRTSGYKTQILYDRELSRMDVSSLKFLKFKYNKDIHEFPNFYDLNDESNQKFYKEMLQRKRMIDEELESRSIYNSSSVNKDYYDSETGGVFNDNGIEYTISFDEDEGEYIFNYKDGGKIVTTFEEERDDLDKSDIKVESIKVGNKAVGIKISESKRTLEDIYKDWNYTCNEE